MAGNIYQDAGTLATLLSTELNSLASGSFATASSAYDNTPGTLGAFTGDFELVAATGSNMTAGNTFDLYLLESVDGANYAGTSGPPPGCFAGSFVCQAETSGRYVLRGVPLPPAKFKAYLKNGSGVALSASGSTLKMLPVMEKYT